MCWSGTSTVQFHVALWEQTRARTYMATRSALGIYLYANLNGYTYVANWESSLGNVPADLYLHSG